ncbi:hypothetical protein Hanom_Chr00s000003g01605771 [Helianthus anomalus]
MLLKKDKDCLICHEFSFQTNQIVYIVSFDNWGSVKVSSLPSTMCQYDDMFMVKLNADVDRK